MAAPVIFRRRLVSAINATSNHVLYIHGPAGFGKSLLAKQWADGNQDPTIWFEGYATSNANELMQGLVNKIGEAIPALKPKLDLLELAESISIQDVINFFSILDKTRVPFNLVIDNAELIRKEHNELSRFIVSELPAHIKLLLITSQSPRSSFLREYGFNRFTILGPNELSFTDEEIAQLAAQIGKKLEPEEISQIQKLTAGWPAGVHIALSQLAINDDFAELITSLKLKGKDQFTQASQRILASLESEQIELLYSLALLEDIDSEAAYQITGDVDAVRILTVLSQESVVVSQSSVNPPKFSIHPIIRSTLLEELKASPELTQKSEQVLSYLLEHRKVGELARILLELGQVKRLSEILKDESFTTQINSSIQDSITCSAIDDLKSWATIARFFPDSGEHSALILNFYIQVLSGNFESADSNLHALRDLIERSDTKRAKRWRTDLYALESIAHYCRGRLNDSFHSAMQAYQHAAADKSAVQQHQITYLQLALYGAVISDDDAKVRMIDEILGSDFIKKSLRHRNSILLAMRSLISAHQGRFAEARNHLVIPLSPDSNSSPTGFFANYGVRIAESMLISESGNLRASLELLEDNLAQGLESKNLPIAIACLGRIAYHHILLGDGTKALESIAQARQIISEHMLSSELHDAIDIWEARVRYLQQDHPRVQDLIKRSNTSYLMRAFEAGMNIGSNAARALELIETFDLRNPRQQLTYHLFRAHIFSQSPISQYEEVKKAVEVGSKHGYFNHFLTQRSDVIQHYISLAADSPTAFHERLARAAGERLNEMMVGNDATGQALTRREADILRHLATGLSIVEIARNLNISRNTIKTHLRNLYRKLGAEDRVDAVEKGKQLLKV